MAARKLSAVLETAGRECWLALTEDDSAVVGRGETPTEAVKKLSAPAWTIRFSYGLRRTGRQRCWAEGTPD